MYITENEIIRISMEMWKWLAKTGAEWKREWPDYEKYKINSYRCECACCFFYNDACRNCPLAIGASCANGYYDEWNDPKTKQERKKAAKGIYELLKKRHDKLERRAKWSQSM